MHPKRFRFYLEELLLFSKQFWQSPDGLQKGVRTSLSLRRMYTRTSSWMHIYTSRGNLLMKSFSKCRLSILNKECLTERYNLYGKLEILILIRENFHFINAFEADCNKHHNHGLEIDLSWIAGFLHKSESNYPPFVLNVMIMNHKNF